MISRLFYIKAHFTFSEPYDSRWFPDYSRLLHIPTFRSQMTPDDFQIIPDYCIDVFFGATWLQMISRLFQIITYFIFSEPDDSRWFPDDSRLMHISSCPKWQLHGISEPWISTGWVGFTPYMHIWGMSPLEWQQWQSQCHLEHKHLFSLHSCSFSIPSALGIKAPPSRCTPPHFRGTTAGLELYTWCQSVPPLCGSYVGLLNFVLVRLAPPFSGIYEGWVH